MKTDEAYFVCDSFWNTFLSADVFTTNFFSFFIVLQQKSSFVLFFFCYPENQLRRNVLIIYLKWEKSFDMAVYLFCYLCAWCDGWVWVVLKKKKERK